VLKEEYQRMTGREWPTPLRSEEHVTVASLESCTGLDPVRVAREARAVLSFCIPFPLLIQHTAHHIKRVI
jgi:hypothetical protein